MPILEKPSAIDQIREPVLKDLQATDQLICTELFSNTPLIQEITRHIINSGGKRLRPLLVLLSARACGYEGDGGEQHELAAIIEFVHTATLLHDDVVDASTLRRGKDTANALWGNQASVLVGDFLYSRAFQLMTRRNNLAVMKCLANTTNAIAEGEVQQLMNQHDPDISEENYFQVIYHKTAKLFESAAEIGAMISNQPKQVQEAMAAYGNHLGMAFQIADDLLDYLATKETLGKNIGDDLAEGKVTLPLIHAMQFGSNEQKELIRGAILKGNIEELPKILLALESTQSIEYSQQKAAFHAETADQALAVLPNTPYRKSLERLAAFAIKRQF